MGTNRITTIGRPFDYGYLTNWLMAIISFLTFVSTTIVSTIHGETFSKSLLTGVGTGLFIFLLWAISRELDPDNDWSAFVPVSLSLLILTFSERPMILVFLWLLLILRVVNHSTGMPAGIMDSLFIVLLGLTMTYYISWIYGVITATGFVIDSQLKYPAKYHIPAGILMLFASAIICIENGGMVFIRTLENLYPAILGSILFIPVIVNKKKLVSVGDRTGKSLDTVRIRAAKLMAILAFIIIAAIQGEMNVLITSFMFCIFAGIGTYRIIVIIVAKAKTLNRNRG
ncbi:hypothetical protein [Methanolobus sp.]|jgi:hypothetical protein|uniref:hypothetical protein n=1 Tax=Methanolobus sp. TaxID=1874737 RepID=UPI0025DD2D82|nr:hypothetical protein [Methanolobus sp.]